MKIAPVVIGLAVVAAVLVASVNGCGQSPGLSGNQVDGFLSVQQTLADQQRALGRGRDDLEADRRLWSERQRHDPIIASAIQSAALLAACCLPVVVLIGLLFRHGREQHEAGVEDEFLLELQSKKAGLAMPESRGDGWPRLEDRRSR